VVLAEALNFDVQGTAVQGLRVGVRALPVEDQAEVVEGAGDLDRRVTGKGLADGVRLALQRLCSREIATLLEPSRGVAERALDRQWAFFRLVEIAGAPPLATFPDVRESLAVAEHEGATLTGERLLEIRTVIAQAHALRRFLRPRAHDFPALADLPEALHTFPELESALGRALDETGALRDDASPRLAELRAELRELRSEIELRLERLVTSNVAAASLRFFSCAVKSTGARSTAAGCSMRRSVIWWLSAAPPTRCSA